MSPLKLLPIRCPSCSGHLMVKSLNCPVCSTTIDGSFDVPLLSRLSSADQQFIMQFVRNSGSLKEMAKELGFSYPTVRNMLDEVISRLKEVESSLKNLP